MTQDNNNPMKAAGGTGKPNTVTIYNPETFQQELRTLLRFKLNPDAMAKLVLILIGTILLPLTLIGLLIGYAVSYKKFMFEKNEYPRLDNTLPFIVKFAMGLGVLVVWTLFIVAMCLLRVFLVNDLLTMKLAIIYCGTNMILSLAAYAVFRNWRTGIHNMLIQRGQHGTARYANEEDLKPFTDRPGLFVGGKMTLADKGNILTVAGARGGKNVNLIINAILGCGGYTGSYFIIDCKGELASICSRGLREQGKRVVTLNAWDLLQGHITGNDTYNPLDLLSDNNSQHLIDDVGILAEMLLPPKPNDHNSFFTDSARNLLSGLLLHLVCSDKYKNPTLPDLWEMCRLAGDDWDNLLADMATSTHPVNGKAIRQAANEILKQSGSPETFSSIVSNVLEATSFLKSNALQKSLVSGFSPYALADGNTVVFLIIPVDKLKSMGAFLRMVTVSMMRAVVRKPQEKVTFLVDEAAFLGPVSEFSTAMATYPGMNITMWLVFQDLPQIKALYGDMYESIISNATVRQYFSLKDNMTCDYVSKAAGISTNTIYKHDWMGNISNVENTKRDLMTPDEVRVTSKTDMLIFTGENPVALVPKAPYYLNPDLFKDGKPIFDPNPYIENSK